jgi:hypothetical protein
MKCRYTSLVEAMDKCILTICIFWIQVRNSFVAETRLTELTQAQRACLGASRISLVPLLLPDAPIRLLLSGQKYIVHMRFFILSVRLVLA